jgi:o-succinylbenzoate synthase
VRIVAARIRPYRLVLRTPLETAHERLTTRSGHLVSLEAEDGTVGWGDACPIAGFGMEPCARAADALARLAREWVGGELGDLDRAWDRLDGLAPAEPAARCAFSAAGLDLLARSEGVALADRIARATGAQPRRALPVSCLVVGEDATAIARSAAEGVARGFATFKLKVGVLPWRRDLARVAALRAAVGDAARIRVDANGSLSEPVARTALADLRDLGVELVEQPVAHDDVHALARLRAGSGVPIAADEAVTTVEAAQRILEAGAADVLVLKPAALGGADRAIAVARAAHAHGCAVLVTSLIDSAIGVAGAAHLAAALPGPRPADGLATGALFEADLATALRVEAGLLALPSGPGLGVAPHPDALERLATGPTCEIRA